MDCPSNNIIDDGNMQKQERIHMPSQNITISPPRYPNQPQRSGEDFSSPQKIESRMLYFPKYCEIPKFDPTVEKEDIKKAVKTAYVIADNIHDMVLPENERMNILIWGYPGDGKESLLSTLLSIKDHIQHIQRQRDRMCIFNLRNRVSIIVPWDYNPGMYDSNNNRTEASDEDMRNEGEIEYQAFKNIIEGKINNGVMKNEVLSAIRNNTRLPRGNAELAATCVLFCVDSNRYSEDLVYLKPFADYCKLYEIKHLLVMTKVDVLINKAMENVKNPQFKDILKYKNTSHALQITNNEGSYCDLRDSFLKRIGSFVRMPPMICYRKGISVFASSLIFQLNKVLLGMIFERKKEVKEINDVIFKGETPKEIEYCLSRKLDPSKFRKIGNHLNSSFYDEIIKKPRIVDFMNNPEGKNLSCVKSIEKDSGLLIMNLNILIDVYYKYLHFHSSRTFLKARLFIVENSSILNSRIIGLFFPRDYIYPLTEHYVENENCFSHPTFDEISPSFGGFNQQKDMKKEEEEEEKPLFSCVYFEAEIDQKTAKEIDKSWNRNEEDLLLNASFEFIDKDEQSSTENLFFNGTKYLRLSFGNSEIFLTRTNYLDIHKKIEEFIQKDKKNQKNFQELMRVKKTLKVLEKRQNEFEKQVIEYIEKNEHHEKMI